MIQTKTLEKILTILKKECKKWPVPVVGVIAETKNDRAFYTLISTILSLRTKDATTMAASERLLNKASTPQKMIKLSLGEIEKLIYPVSFYRNKAKSIHITCEILIQQHGGKVPKEMGALLALPGVGRKTANLVLTIGLDLDGICVDTHVHRISNRWGYIQTKLPDETEMVLRKKLPRKHWKTYNDYLVAFGQNLCVPISPWCSRCMIKQYCLQVGVTKSR